MARFVAVFEVRVGGESGVRVGRFAQDFTPFDVVESGYPVRVVPVVVRHTEEDYIGPEAELVHYKVPYLDLPRAEVTIELDATPLDKVEGGKVYGEPRRIATEVLVRTLAHIREVLGDVSVNVTPHLWRAKEYRDESGAVVKGPFWVSFGLGLEAPPADLTEHSWDRIATSVAAGERVPIGHEWIHDARAFRDAHNYSMALVSAAVACEVYGYSLLRRRLSEGGRATTSMVDGFLEQVSRRDLFPTLFRYFDIGKPEMAKQITSVFNERNDIVHGKRSKKRQVEEEQAATAITLAEFFEAAERADREERHVG